MTLSVTMPVGTDELEFPLGEHVNKSGKPYWLFDALGNETRHKAMNFGCRIDGTESLDLPDLLSIGDGTTEVMIDLATETVVTSKDGTRTYFDRKVAKSEIHLPNEDRPRPIRVSLSRKQEGDPWNMRITVTNPGGGGAQKAKVSLADLLGR